MKVIITAGAILAALLVALWILFFGAVVVMAHAPYDSFYSGGAPGIGRWCCNGDLNGTTGDCAPATYTMLRNGDALMVSKRYPGKQIHVAAHRILWMALPGGEMFEAHYCGVPRTSGGPAPTADDPDPEFITYCVAIAPGGV